jgi:uncharacterized protein YndB with AHSA1/START domain
MTAVEIVETGTPYIVSRAIWIDARPEQIFDLLADPRRHADFDGSGSVTGSASGPERLSLGAKFGMGMRIVVPYRVGNQVKEFEEGRRIAWAHLSGHRWRYELEPAAHGGTRVVETFDATTARSAQALKLMDAYRRNARAIEETLPRLKALAEEER